MSKQDNKVNTSSGVGFLGALFLMFLWLKLNPGGNFATPIADWSWWLVFMPIIAIPLFFVAIFLIWFISFIFLKITGSK